jgi:RNA polymerase sigma-70 factor, ECF subfamily
LQGKVQESEFLALLHQYQPLIRKVCAVYAHTREDREDLFQEIAAQLWRALPGFRGEAQHSTWMYRIALNTAISGLRKQRNQPATTSKSDLPDLPDEPYDPTIEEQRRRLYRAFEALSDVERAMLLLYLEDRSYDEMESILGVSQNTLRVRMKRVKEKLRTLTKHDHGN